jgi:hypothetical protein
MLNTCWLAIRQVKSLPFVSLDSPRYCAQYSLKAFSHYTNTYSSRKSLFRNTANPMGDKHISQREATL